VKAVRFVRTHLDTVLAVALALAFGLEVYRAAGEIGGRPVIARLRLDDAVAVGLVFAFLLSLALRSRLPLFPLALAYPALAGLGSVELTASVALLLGLALAAYSVGAWAGGRSGQVGALGVGALIGLLVLRAGTPASPRDIAGPVLVLLGPWLLGLAARGARARRGDARVLATRGWGSGVAAPDSAGRDETVRDLRDIIERAMSAVILQARTARRSLERDPHAAHEALVVVEAAATDALEETQRLTGLLLSPDGTPLPEPQPGLGDLDFLIEEVTKAGLPVDMHVTGRVVPLTPDLDAVAYRVVHEALQAALDGARDGTASITVRYQPDALEVEVVDDGVAADDGMQTTSGLEAVRAEVAALGGTLDAGPRKGRGYWVLAELPYEADWS
jgi:hypothetical protein